MGLTSPWRRAGRGRRPRVGERGEPEFAVVATHAADGNLEVLVVGELDLLTAPELRRSVVEELHGRGVRVDIVCNAVSFVDSSGLLALLELRDLVVGRQGTFRLVAPSASFRYLLALAGLTDRFEIA